MSRDATALAGLLCMVLCVAGVAFGLAAGRFVESAAYLSYAYWALLAHRRLLRLNGQIDQAA